MGSHETEEASVRERIMSFRQSSSLQNFTVFTSSTSNRGIILKIYKIFNKLDIQKPNNPIKIGVES